jgi:hypothetical protein
MTNRRRMRHTPGQIVRKLRDAHAMLDAGNDLAVVVQALQVSQSTYARCRWKRRWRFSLGFGMLPFVLPLGVAAGGLCCKMQRQRLTRLHFANKLK